MIIFLILVLLSVLTAQSVPFAINAQESRSPEHRHLNSWSRSNNHSWNSHNSSKHHNHSNKDYKNNSLRSKHQNSKMLSCCPRVSMTMGSEVSRLWERLGIAGTEPAEFVQPFATFRDAQGAVVDTAFTYAEKERITSGDTSPFNLFIVSEVVKQQAKTYDLGLEWQDQQGNEFTSDVLSNQPFIPGAVSATSISRQQ